MEVDRAANRVVVIVIVLVQVLAARAVATIRACGGVSKEAAAASGIRKQGGCLDNNHGFFGLEGLVGVLGSVLGYRSPES